MCIYSNVLDHYNPLIPYPHQPAPTPVAPAPIQPSLAPSWPWTPAMTPDQLREVLNEFKEAMGLAKKLDELMGHADCERAEKLKLMGRVEVLEKKLVELKKPKKTNRRRRRKCVKTYR